MKGFQIYGQGMLMLWAIVIITVVFLVSLARSGLFIFSSSNGRAARARKVITITTKRLVVVMVLGYAGNYLWGVRQRSHATTWHDVRSDMDSRYVASYSYLWDDRILLRLYEAQSSKLLAERTYSYPDEAKLVWTGHALIYDTAADGDDGKIDLPPSLYDRLTARLP